MTDKLVNIKYEQDSFRSSGANKAHIQTDRRNFKNLSFFFSTITLHMYAIYIQCIYEKLKRFYGSCSYFPPTFPSLSFLHSPTSFHLVNQFLVCIIMCLHTRKYKLFREQLRRTDTFSL